MSELRIEKKMNLKSITSQISFQTLTRFSGRLVLVWGIGFMKINVVKEFISILSIVFRSAIPRKFSRVGDDAGEDVGRSS